MHCLHDLQPDHVAHGRQVRELFKMMESFVPDDVDVATVISMNDTVATVVDILLLFQFGYLGIIQ